MMHMQSAGTQSGGAEGCITQERQQQSDASHKSDGARDVHKQSHIARKGGTGLNPLKFGHMRTRFLSARH